MSVSGGGPPSVAPVTTGEALPRDERVLQRSDYLTAQARGRRLHGEHFVLIVFARGDGGPARIGVTVSRKVGNSVVRHQVKRWVREVFRRNKSAFGAGVDVVAIAREAKVPAAFDVVRDELLGLMAHGSRSAPRARRSESGDGNRPGGTGARERSDAKHRGR